jgi:hypothetical protein
MKQQADVVLERPDFRTRVLQMEWLNDAEVEVDARFITEANVENKTIDSEKWKEIVLAGWHEFTDAGHAARMVIPDVEVGVARLRAMELRNDGGLLGVAFGAPELFIANQSNSALHYRTKILSSDWSPNFTLKQGERAKFKVPTDMLIRLDQGGRIQEFNLAAGSTSVYRSAKPDSPPTLYAESQDLVTAVGGTGAAQVTQQARSQSEANGLTIPPPPPSD